MALNDLVVAGCRPLLARHAGTRVKPDQEAVVELYLAPPPTVSRDMALRHNLATRNFFAWVFNRPMVGEHLGIALIEVLRRMDEFRTPGADNLGDLVRYLDDQGYLAMTNQPVHAVAMLHFADDCRLRDMYIDAFTHCVGMSDRLSTVLEFRTLSPVITSMVPRAAAAMNRTLGLAGLMLANFLEDDLSEAHIGLTLAGRAHLEKFRAFLLTYYVGRFGYYPPAPAPTEPRGGLVVFEPWAYRVMRDDFQAVYEHLVDTSFTTLQSSPPLAQGGICTLQSVHAFDLRNRYDSLPHPLPLLPHMPPPSRPRRLSWLLRPEKKKLPRSEPRVTCHAALMKATNTHRVDLMQNGLVVAYRRFEEDSILSTNKPSRSRLDAKLSLVDARKIRWILIYAIYQVVRSCTEPPPECRDVRGAQYNVAVPTAGLPPWPEQTRPMSVCPVSRPDLPLRTSPSRHSWTAPEDLDLTPSEPIRPDIDYITRTRFVEPPKRSHCPGKRSTASADPIPSHRRSLRKAAPTPSRRQSYHEIVVHGYGNGLNDVLRAQDRPSSPSPMPPSTATMTTTTQGTRSTPSAPRPRSPPPPPPLPVRHAAESHLANRTASTSSTSSAALSRATSVASASAGHSPCTEYTASSCTVSRRSSLRLPFAAGAFADHVTTKPRHVPQSQASAPLLLTPTPTPRPRARAQTVGGVARNGHMASGARDLGRDVPVVPPCIEEEQQMPPELPRRSRRRNTREGLSPLPLVIRKGDGPTVTAMPSPENRQEYTGQEGTSSSTCSGPGPGTGSTRRPGQLDMWEQFEDLGGLTDVSTPTAEEGGAVGLFGGGDGRAETGTGTGPGAGPRRGDGRGSLGGAKGGR